MKAVVIVALSFSLLRSILRWAQDDDKDAPTNIAVIMAVSFDILAIVFASIL